MPLQRRVPKFGFKNINRVEYKAINLDTIQKLAEVKSLVKVGINDFIEAGFISSNQLVKVLGNGTLTNKLEVEAHACLLYTSPSPRDVEESRMPSSA